MMTLLSDTRKTTQPLLMRAQVFANNLPQSQGARKEGRSFVLTYIVDEKLPSDVEKYRHDNVDKYALQAFHRIFSDADEIELLLKDLRLVFTVLFWDGQELAEQEFVYSISELLLLKSSN